MDGCIGLSYLNRFFYRIENQDVPHLYLEDKTKLDIDSNNDVFISCKSSDIGYAKKIYEFLIENGRRPFLFTKDIRHRTEFMNVIDDAIESADHLILICSTQENAMAPWVQTEWQTFRHFKNSGLKTGNLIPFLCGSMSASELPTALRTYNALHIKNRDWRKRLLDYLHKGVADSH